MSAVRAPLTHVERAVNLVATLRKAREEARGIISTENLDRALVEACHVAGSALLNERLGE